MPLHLHYSIAEQQSQAEILHDRDEKGRERPWALYKRQAQYLAVAYQAVDEGKAKRVDGCASALLFKRGESGKLKLACANFCRVRLCPVCAWRRSMRTHAHMRKILAAAAEQQKLQYLMVTLTLRNCSGSDLSATLDSLIGGFKRLSDNLCNKAGIWVGWYRGVEVTHNMRSDTFHPHIHALVAVKPSYFKGGAYISQAELAEKWRAAAQVDYAPIVDIRKVYDRSGKGDIIHAVAEVAKYATKASDIINYDDWGMTEETVRTLDSALNRRRFVAYGGLFKALHKALNLTDEEEGDLVHIDEGTEGSGAADELLFWWHTGYMQYVR